MALCSLPFSTMEYIVSPLYLNWQWVSLATFIDHGSSKRGVSAQIAIFTVRERSGERERAVWTLWQANKKIVEYRLLGSTIIHPWTSPQGVKEMTGWFRIHSEIILPLISVWSVLKTNPEALHVCGRLQYKLFSISFPLVTLHCLLISFANRLLGHDRAMARRAASQSLHFSRCLLSSWKFQSCHDGVCW